MFRIPARDSKTAAISTLAAWCLIVLVALTVPQFDALPPPPPGVSDVVTFRRVVERVRAGEPYYAAFGDQLREGLYPAAQAFNWRTPLLLSTLATVSDNAGTIAWILFAILMCAASVWATARESPTVPVAAVLMLVGGVSAMDPPAARVMAEGWVGILIGLSVCAYLRGRQAIGVLLGLLALLVRELAAPYCVVCTLRALAKRRWHELAGWATGAGAYVGYYLWHLTNVWAAQQPGDLAHPAGWLQVGNLPFLLTATRFNRWLHVAPLWLVAATLAFVVIGTLVRTSPLYVRLAGMAYLTFFLFAGQAFNGYWGLVAWPVWALACGYGVEAVGRSASILAGAGRPTRAPAPGQQETANTRKGL